MKTVKARVKPTNCYGGYGAGAIVEVDESELERAHWCLEPVEDEPRARAAAAKERAEHHQHQADLALAEYEALRAELEAAPEAPPPPPEPPPEPAIKDDSPKAKKSKEAK